MKKKLQPKTDRAQNLEAKGDRLRKKKSYQQALEAYRQAQTLNPLRVELYDKLIECHGHVADQFNDQDFAETLSWTMQKQELEHPRLKRVHAHFAPEWKDVSGLIHKMILSADDAQVDDLVEKIVAYGEKALYPLVDLVLRLKSMGKKGPL